MTGVLKPTERIGVVLVHGIGEQGRFEHLEDHVRPLIEAIKLRDGPNRGSKVTVEVIEGAASTLHAEQQSWACGPGASVRATIVTGPPGAAATKEISFHEVWWADVNEPYSLMKQIRFWGWGLSVWLYPPKAKGRPGAKAMDPPTFPGLNPKRMNLKVRAKLFGVANIFLMAAFSIGALTFLLKRLFDFSAPSIIRIFVNYIGGVKLYVQPRRAGGEFLDALGEAPRVSVRRRMVRTLMDVALVEPGYDRWYVFAHSLGSVVAFNGLMENCQALPNYLDQERWENLRNHSPPLAGTAEAGLHRLGATADMLPARPVWLAADDVVYREILFERFRGFLTFGCPLDKFAAIWADRVPINVKEPAFDPDAQWVNVYDPTDPVGAHLDAYSVANPTKGLQLLPPPINHAYRAHWALLLSHVRYMHLRGHQQASLADALASWIVDGGQFAAPAPSPGGLWVAPGSNAERRRKRWARLMWFIVYVALTLAATLTLLLAWTYAIQPAWVALEDGLAKQWNGS